MAEKSKLWYLENFNIFRGMEKDQMMNLSQISTMKNAEKDQYIYFPEEPSSTIFFLKEGRIKIGSFSDDGRENIKVILQPGELFGELALAGEEKRSDFAQALDDNTLICALQMKDMEGIMEKNPKLILKITKLIGLRLRRVERRLDSLIFKDVRTRVIDFLRDMVEEQGVKVGDEMMIKHNLTHQDIANLTATTRQSVTTILGELRDKNLIYMERNKILVRDVSKLV